jgi:pyruvate/2-oxoglutarate dehydrogenase complex dihydrolipoamide dehydrogenase (E3) component
MADLERLDAVVIGTGQGGKPLAEALAEAGWRVAIIERDRVGGTCIVRGCTPTKTMLASARVAHLARRARDFGVLTESVTVDLAAVRRRKRDIVDSWSTGNERSLQRHETLELIRGAAKFVGPRTVEVALSHGGKRMLTGEHVFINVGARNRVPSVPGLDSVDYLDSTSVMELGSVPDHLIVLGGGFTGLELGQMFRRFGASVTVVERSRLVSREDEDVSKALEDILRGEGIDVVTGAEARSVAASDGRVAVTVSVAGKERVIRGTHLLVATGVVPNTEALDLQSAGIDVSEDGSIAVDDRCQTSAEGVWALGDVTGAPPFTHVSYDDYRVIRRNLLEGGNASRAERLVPYVLFTDPQLGRVGMSEREAKRSGRRFRVAKLPMRKVARAIETDETRGFMKALVDADTGAILGGAILGVEGGEVVTVLQMAMMGGLPWTALRDAVIAHPTLSESLNNLFMTL